MGSFPNGLPLGMFGWSKYKILPVYGEKRPIYVYSYLDTKIYTFIYTEKFLKCSKTNVIPSMDFIWKTIETFTRRIKIGLNMILTLSKKT